MQSYWNEWKRNGLTERISKIKDVYYENKYSKDFVGDIRKYC